MRKILLMWIWWRYCRNVLDFCIIGIFYNFFFLWREKITGNFLWNRDYEQNSALCIVCSWKKELLWFRLNNLWVSQNICKKTADRCRLIRGSPEIEMTWINIHILFGFHSMTSIERSGYNLNIREHYPTDYLTRLLFVDSLNSTSICVINFCFVNLFWTLFRFSGLSEMQVNGKFRKLSTSMCFFISHILLWGSEYRGFLALHLFHCYFKNKRTRIRK